MVATTSRDVATRIGTEVERLMHIRELTFDALAIETGISRSRLHRLTKGNALQWLPAEELDAIAHALGTTPSKLLLAAGYPVAEPD